MTWEQYILKIVKYYKLKLMFESMSLIMVINEKVEQRIS